LEKSKKEDEERAKEDDERKKIKKEAEESLVQNFLGREKKVKKLHFD